MQKPFKPKQQEQKSFLPFFRADEERNYCFDNIYNLGLMLKDNYELFQNMIDSKTIKQDEDQEECLSFLLSPKQFESFCAYLFSICDEARQIKGHAFGGYAYIKFQDDIFYLNIMADRERICQFALVEEIPEEDKDVVPFDIEKYGLETIAELYAEKKLKKCIMKACLKYKVRMKDNPNLYPNEDFYYVSPGLVAYHFNSEFDSTLLKRLALIYLCWGKQQVKKPIFTELAQHLKGWEKGLQQMERDGIKLIGHTEEKYYVKDKIIRNFINYDVFMFFKRINGLFEEQKDAKVKVTYTPGAAHVEIDDRSSEDDNN